MALSSPSFNSKVSSNQFAARRKQGGDGISAANWTKVHNSIKSMNKYGGPKRYTMKQIKQHNKKDDCWMVLNGHVFDITEYIPYHPGGDEILKAKGADGTALFYKVFH